MPRPTPIAVLGRVTLAVICLHVAGAVTRGDENADALTRAIQLFEEGRYLAAQEELLRIDRDKLSATDQATRDDYLARARVGATMVDKAVSELDNAEAALRSGDRDQAREWLRSVLANEYATASVRSAAESQLRQMDQPETAATDDLPAPAAEPTAPAAEAAHPAAQANPTREAANLTAKGFEAMQNGHLAEARRWFEQALAVVPGYPEATNGLVQVDAHARVESGDTSLIDRIRGRNRIFWQRAVTSYREVAVEARDHVLHDRYVEARQSLVRARHLIESARQYADPLAKYEGLLSELAALERYVQEEERRYNETKVRATREEINRQRRQRLEQVAEARRRQMDALMQQALQHRKDREYEQAVEVLKQVLAVDARNDRARWLMEDLQDLAAFRQQHLARKNLGRETQLLLGTIEEAKIPWHKELNYPKNWLELITRPERQAPGREFLDPLDAALREKLSEPTPVSFNEQSLESALAQLADAKDVNLNVVWHDLAQAGVIRDTPVTLLYPSPVSFGTVLEHLLEQAGGPAQLGYAIDGGVIKIASQALLDRNTVVRVYNIRDLLMVVPNFDEGPNVDLAKTSQVAAADGTGAPLFGRGGSGNAVDGEDEGKARIDDVIDLIERTVARESWRQNGGVSGSIAELNGTLVITQTAAAHEEIADLLSKIREERAVQIAVESRFITVQSNFLEELGIDLDIVLNNGNAGFDFVPGLGGGTVSDPTTGTRLLLPRTFTRLGFTPSVPGVGSANVINADGAGGTAIPQPFGSVATVPQRGNGIFSGQSGSPVPIISNLLNLTATRSSDFPGSFGGTSTPAINIFGSFLDNIQVDFLLRATQADARSTLLTAPRLVLSNGQRAWLAFTRQRNYVSNLQAIVATGAAAQQPTTSVIESGAVLDVQAVASADRRYVTMTLRPAVARLDALDSFPFGNGFLQQPSISRQQINTTVSVPDGGTLLIGGQKLASEVEIEAGVPVLSKIPVLKRLYSSRSVVKDEQVLLILVKPRIIIHSETEQEAFPTFSSAL